MNTYIFNTTTDKEEEIRMGIYVINAETFKESVELFEQNEDNANQKIVSILKVNNRKGIIDFQPPFVENCPMSKTIVCETMKNITPNYWILKKSSPIF